jgi:hypothetical protein
MGTGLAAGWADQCYLIHSLQRPTAFTKPILACTIGDLLSEALPGARLISVFHPTMNHPTRTPQPPMSNLSCPIELGFRVIPNNRPSWEELLGQR